MTRWQPALLAIALFAIGFSPASAQGFCPEGKTFSGTCVKPGIASAMRRQTLAYTQPKHSYTAPPRLPSEDGEYYVPRDYNELRTLFGINRTTTGCVPVVVIGIGVFGCQ